MTRTGYGVAIALSACLLSLPAMSMEKMTDEQLSNVQAQGTYNFAFDNIEFRGVETAGGAEAGSIRSVGTDGSSLSLNRFQFTADNIGTLTMPLTTQSVLADPSVNGTALPDRHYLRIGLPDAAGWSNVDIVFDALYGNPTELDTSNPYIASGVGTPSDRLEFGRISFDNLSLAGKIDVSSIPEGYKIRSVRVADGSALALSRQGLLLNIGIDRLAVDQMLFEPGQADGLFTPSQDLVINNFVLENLQLTSATIETTPSGWRLAYSDPKSFSGSLGEVLQPGVSGHPTTEIPDSMKANLSFQTQMTHGQVSESRLSGVTLDHLVFNVRTD